MRGKGGRPSITSSSAVSSPNRYSSGPVTSVTGTVSVQPAASISAMAARSRSASVANAALVAMITESAPTAWAAISAPSSTRYGIGAQDRPVLERAGFALGGVDHDGRRERRGAVGDDRPPLARDGEAGAAATAQAGGVDQVDDRGGVDAARRAAVPRRRRSASASVRTGEAGRTRGVKSRDMRPIVTRKPRTL